MAKFNRPEKKDDNVEKIVALIENEIENGELEPIEQKPIAWEEIPVISTGSTLLDLSISGGRTETGGIPACILAEIYGPAGSGKTSVLATVGGNAQTMGLGVHMQDPEERVDKEYSRIYEIELDKSNYSRPRTVEEVFDFLGKNKPGVLLTDSLAALTTELEQETGDKMGMRRAKLFSAGLRVNAGVVSQMLWLCSNQERQGDKGFFVPGGKAIEYYSSLRVRIYQKRIIEIEKTNAYGVKLKKAIGIQSECLVKKSTVDDPYRLCPIYIIFGYGIDDVRGNLQYLKDMQNLTGYPTPDGKKFRGIEQAIEYVEKNGLQEKLKKETISMWREIDEMFKTYKRSRKNEY